MILDLRKKPEELAVRARLHPDLRDIYVEGPRDKAFYKWFFNESNRRHVIVYLIDTIDLPDCFVEALAVQCNGNRGRLVALSLYLDRQLSEAPDGIACIVDRDFDKYCYNLVSAYPLFKTDFCCLEAYFCDFGQLEKIFGLFFAREISTGEISDLLQVLSELFALRLSRFLMSSTVPWPSKAHRYWRNEESRIIFDGNGFISALDRSSKGSLDILALLQHLDSFGDLKPTDVREMMNGHDFIALVAWLANAKGASRSLANETVIARTIVFQCRAQELLQHSLFVRLLSWADHQKNGKASAQPFRPS